MDEILKELNKAFSVSMVTLECLNAKFPDAYSNDIRKSLMISALKLAGALVINEMDILDNMINFCENKKDQTTSIPNI